MRAPLPPDEQTRLETLRDLEILDTAPERSYDDIVMLASEICDAPIAAISFVDEDRQWFKSIHGLDVQETPRDVAFCAHTILESREQLIVEDARKDPRFADNALVTGDPSIRFYAGTPLVIGDGTALGTLCVIDRRPRTLTPSQKEALAVLGHQVVVQLQLRHALRDLQDTVIEVKKAQADVARTHQEQDALRDRFFSHVSHELRSPLTSIYQFVTILLDGIGGELTSEQREHLETVLQNVHQLKRMIGDLLEVTRARTGKLRVVLGRLALADLVRDVTRELAVQAREKDITLRTEIAPALPEAIGDAGRLRQVLFNLVGNAIKFAPEGGTVRLHVQHDDDAGSIRVTVADTGPGIEPKHLSRVFDELYQVPDVRRASREGLGLGLFISRELVARHGGRIWVESEPGRGCQFHFTVPAFEIDRLLVPLLTRENLQRGTMALIGVRVYPVGGVPARGDQPPPLEALLDRIRTWATPPEATLLPCTEGDDLERRFVVVAMVAADQAARLETRIRDGIHVSRELTSTGWECTLSPKMIVLPRGLEARDPREVMDEVAELIEEHVQPSARRKAA